MADSDQVERFFHELDRRGHEPLLERMQATGHVELYDGGRTEHWLLTVRGGYVAASRSDGPVEADWVVKADRRAFERVIHGDASALAALIRGTLSVQLVDPKQKLGLITRLFAGPPESRERSTDDKSLTPEAANRGTA